MDGEWAPRHQEINELRTGAGGRGTKRRFESWPTVGLRVRRAPVTHGILLADPERHPDARAGPAFQCRQNRPRRIRLGAIARRRQLRESFLPLSRRNNSGSARHDALPHHESLKPTSIGKIQESCLASIHSQTRGKTSARSGTMCLRPGALMKVFASLASAKNRLTELIGNCLAYAAMQYIS
jgi:hypothetical protein